jgi:hypothetical protein
LVNTMPLPDRHAAARLRALAGYFHFVAPVAPSTATTAPSADSM